MTGTIRPRSGAELSELFGELLDRLASRGIAVDAYIIGGVAIAIHLGGEELTPDVDGMFRPQHEVFAEAAVMAEEYDLPKDWVNSNSQGFAAFDITDDVGAAHIELHGHPVTVASKRALLAMKIAASRAKDRPDLNRLIVDMGVTDAEEIVDLAFAVFGDFSVVLPESRDEVRLIAQEALDRAAVYRVYQGGLDAPVMPAPELAMPQPEGSSAGSPRVAAGSVAGRCGKPRTNGKGFCMRRVGEHGCPYHG